MEKSEFAIDLELNINEGFLKELPAKLDKLGSSILNSFQNIFKSISFGTEAAAAELEDLPTDKFKFPENKNPGAQFPERPDIDKFLSDNPRVGIAGAILLAPAFSALGALDQSVNGEVTELERLHNLQQKILDRIHVAEKTLELIDIRGESPEFKSPSGLPFDKDFVLIQKVLLEDLFRRIETAKLEVTTGVISADIPRPPQIRKEPQAPFKVDPDKFRFEPSFPLRNELKFILKDQDEFIKKRNIDIQELIKNDSTAAKSNKEFAESAKNTNVELQNQSEKVNQAKETLGSLGTANEKIKQSGIETNQVYKDQAFIYAENADAVLNAGFAQSTLATNNQQLTESVKAQSGELQNNVQQVQQVDETLGNLGITAEDVTSQTDDLTGNAEDLADTMKDSKKKFDQAGKSIDNFDGSAVDLGTNLEKTDEVAQQLGGESLPEIGDGAKVAGEGVVKATEEGKKGLESLGVFAGNIATNIAESFSGFISTAIKGDFDGIEDLWDNLLDSLQDSIADFVAGLIANPIRIAFEATLNGQEGNIFDLIGGLFNFGGGSGGDESSPDRAVALGNVITAAQNPFDTAGISEAIEAFNASGEAAKGILSSLSSVAGTVGQVAGIIGTVVAVVLSVVNIVKGLFEKKPQLDVDLDKIRDEFGNSTGQAAKVLDFLDDEIANSIINISTKRKAGVGGGDGIKKQIREALQTQIKEIQDIIFSLPADIAASLNELLLNTEVDIESQVKGDRLLEFDESKNISQKFEQFINGDLQARFLFAIRDFFVGAFESLGVLGEAAQSFVDGKFEEFQGLSREERIEAGKEFLQDFQTLTDAFNVLNDNGADSIGATVNSIKNLSTSLGFDAVPSIEELDAGLEELINAAELDPDIIQDYLDLRNAILEAQRAILNSIQSIISSIKSLNSIIVDGGGSAFDLTGFINEGIGNVVDLLGQDGLSIEDKEELLGIGTGFLDQLIAEEQAAFQAQLEAAQKAAEAAAEAQREAVRVQIEALEAERDLIEENFDKRLEALEEELRIAEEFARLTESIKQTLDSIILGPDSVFTAVERLNIVQGDIASLQSELAATTDPEKQLELAAKLEDSLSTLFDLAGEAFGVNSPEFVAIFDQVTGGLNDLLDLTGNRERSVEEINAAIEALNIERNETLEAIDAQIEGLNDQLSSIQAQNVEATFQVSDHVLELAEFFRNEYVTLLEERFAQLEEVSDSGFTEELDALNSIDANFSQFKETAIEGLQIQDEMLITLRGIDDTLKGAASFRTGTGGFVDFGSGTLAFLHGREAVVPESQFTPFREFSPASSGDMNVNINVNVDGGSGGTVETLATNIEDMLVRSIRQGGKLRSAVQEAGAKRFN